MTGWQTVKNKKHSENVDTSTTYMNLCKFFLSLSIHYLVNLSGDTLTVISTHPAQYISDAFRESRMAGWFGYADSDNWDVAESCLVVSNKEIAGLPQWL